MLLGHEWHRRAGHDVGDGRQLVGRRLGRRDEPGDGLGRRGQDQHPAVRLGHVVEPVLEARHDPEVAAAAADRPEQVRMVLGVDQQALAVGGHHLGRQHVVDRQPELAHEVADAATERDPADPDRPRVAEPDRQAVRRERPGHLRGGQPGLGPRRPALDVDVEALEVGEVEDDAALGHAVTGAAVATAADGELEARLARETHDVGHVVDVGDLDDDSGSAVDPTGHHGPGSVVVGVAGCDDLALEFGPQLRDREGRGSGLVRRHGSASSRSRRRLVETDPDGAPNMVGSVRREMRLEAVPGLDQALLHPDPDGEIEVLGGREAGDVGERRAGVRLVEGDGDRPSPGYRRSACRRRR